MLSGFNLVLLVAAAGLLLLLLAIRRRNAATGGTRAETVKAAKAAKAPKPPKAPRAPKAAKAGRERTDGRWRGRRRNRGATPPAPPEPLPLAAPGAEEPQAPPPPAPEPVFAPEPAVAAVPAAGEPAEPFGDPGSTWDEADQATGPIAADDPAEDFGFAAETADEPDWDAMRAAMRGETPVAAAHAETAAAFTPAPPAEETAASWGEDVITDPGWPLPGDLDDSWDGGGFGGDTEVAAPAVAAGGEDWLGTAAADAAPAAWETPGQPEAAPDPADQTPAWEADRETAAAWEAAEEPVPAAWDAATAAEDAEPAVVAPAWEGTPSWDGPAPFAAAEAETAAATAFEEVSLETTDPTWGEDVPADPVDAVAETAAAAEPSADTGEGAWWDAEPAPAVPDPAADAEPAAWWDEEPAAETAATVEPPADAEPAAWWDEEPAADAGADETAATVEPPAEAEPTAWWDDEPSSGEEPAAWWDQEPAVAEVAATVAPAPEAPDAGIAPAPDAGIAPSEVAAPAADDARTGHFAIGGMSSAASRETIVAVAFRRPLDAAPAAWTVAGGPGVPGPGTLVLSVEAALNCEAAALEVMTDPGFAPTADGFTLRLTARGDGPFVASGTFEVTPA